MRSVTLLLLLFLLFLNACKEQPRPTAEPFRYTEELKSKNNEVSEVIYSMHLPTDMAGLFNRTGTNYDPAIPAPINSITLYTNPEKIALMLGVYGVNITYMKLLGQTIPAAQYYKAIETLSDKIGIPQTIFEESSLYLEKYFAEEDSLSAVIETIYRKTDRFFRENNRDNLAALSLTGGWIEAMYVGIKIYEADNGNQVMAERLLQQKYSLNSIYTILSNHQESLEVKEYLLMIKKIRKVFDRVEIRYQKKGFNLDTTQKKIQTYNTLIRYDEETMDDLARIIPLVRNSVISYEED